MPIIVASHVESAHVFETEEEVDGTGFAIGNGDGVVVGDLICLGQILSKCNGVLGFGAIDLSDDAKGRPGGTVVSAAAKDDIDGVPVTSQTLARFCIGEDRTLLGDDDSGDAVLGISALAGLENRLALGLFGTENRKEEKK